MSDLRAALRISTTFIDGVDAWPWPRPDTPICANAEAAAPWLATARDAGAASLTFEGGEPLREPSWPALARAVRAAGIDVEIATSGRLLAYPRVAAAVAHAGVARLHVPLFAAPPAVHDAITRVPGAHAQVLEGLAALRRLPTAPDVVLRSWLDVRSAAGLPALVSLARRVGAARLDLRLSPTATNRPSPAACRATLQRVAEAAAAVDLPFTLTDVPLCWAGADLLEPFLAAPTPALFEGATPGLWTQVTTPGTPAPACSWCACAEACPGLPSGARDDDARPVVLPIPNCFELTTVADVPAGEGACARDRWGGPVDPHRHILYESGPRAWLLEAQGNFFPRHRLVETRERGLLYVNVSDRARLDDFRAQLRRLRRAPACQGCNRPCPGAWEAAPEPVLQREEASVLELIETLEGDVLDVGFGPNYHRATFERLHDAGRVRYAGVEPDPAAFAALAADRPDLAWQNTTLEQLEPDGRRFDAVLLLRAWNHLAALPVAVRQLTALLRPGGRLVVVDNVRFGYHLPVGVTPEEGGRYEHYRNHDLADAERVLTSAGFHVVLRIGIAPGGDNQWMLVAEWRES